MSYRIFISSVQKEFAKERKALASYIRKDAILGKSYPANPLLAYAMFLRKYVEQTGTGTGEIIGLCRERGLADPEWRIDDGDDFVTMIPRPQTVDKTVDWSVDWSVDKSSVKSSVKEPSVESTDEKILAILSANPRCTLEELARVLELTKRGVEKAVRRLRLAKRLRKVGGKKLGHWEVL